MVDELWHPDGSGGARHLFFEAPSGERPRGRQPSRWLADERDRDRLRELPEHERDDPETIGGGILDRGGTVIEKGGGTIDHHEPIPGSPEDDAERNEDEDKEPPWAPV